MKSCASNAVLLMKAED
jgi:hypothetical protein